MIMSGPLASSQSLQRPKGHLANLILCLDVLLLNHALLKDGIDKVFDKQGGRRSSQEALPGGHVQGFGTCLSNGKARYCIAVKADRYGLVDPVRPLNHLMVSDSRIPALYNAQPKLMHLLRCASQHDCIEKGSSLGVQIMEVLVWQ
jgi:hypothetical protein